MEKRIKMAIQETEIKRRRTRYKSENGGMKNAGGRSIIKKELKRWRTQGEEKKYRNKQQNKRNCVKETRRRKTNGERKNSGSEKKE